MWWGVVGFKWVGGLHVLQEFYKSRRQDILSAIAVIITMRTYEGRLLIIIIIDFVLYQSFTHIKNEKKYFLIF